MIRQSAVAEAPGVQAGSWGTRGASQLAWIGCSGSWADVPWLEWLPCWSSFLGPLLRFNFPWLEICLPLQTHPVQPHPGSLGLSPPQFPYTQS